MAQSLLHFESITCVCHALGNANEVSIIVGVPTRTPPNVTTEIAGVSSGLANAP